MNSCWQIGLILFIFFCANSAYSDDLDMEKYFSMSPAELSDITVTIASGSAKPVFRSAGSISVITEDQIKTMGATGLAEVLETVPGIHMALQTQTQEPVFTVRGLANESNSQMLILMNGTRITTPLHSSLDFGPDLPLAAVKRIEVIRGPGSAVYGADAFAGVINIITKKPNDIASNQAGVRAGNWNSQSAFGQYSTHLNDWDIGANIQYQGTDGDSGRIIKADIQSVLDKQFNSRASHAPGAMNTDRKSINSHFNLQRKHWDIGFWANNILNSGTNAGSGGSLDPDGKASGDQYLGDVRFSTEDWFDDWEFQAHLSYLNSGVKGDIPTFPDNTRLPIGTDGDIDIASQNFTLFSDGTIDLIDYNQQIPTIEFTSIFSGVEGHQIRFGTGYRYEEIVVNKHLTNFGKGAINGNNLPKVINGILKDVTGTSFSFLKDSHRSIWSAMLQDEWQLANDWSLTSGIRYDYYSDFGNTVNPRLALIWDINKELTGKLMYGRAFRAPNFYELSLQNNPDLTRNQLLKPETINTGELAFDYRPFSTLRTTLNLYYYQIDDLITTAPGSSSFQFQNVGEQQSYGTEFDWNWQVSEQWNLYGNYAWQYSRNSLTKMRISGVPEHQLYLAAKWSFLPQWQFQSQLNWIGGRSREPGDNRPLSDYQSVDFTLRTSRLWDHVNFAASLRNAFDNNNFEQARIQGYPSNFPLPGRSFYFETSVDF
ncbi:MAG: TonB-dependent receptor [Methylococcaceae bacterium]|nr:TonB-dependent receptor [Methylococcaceae bacterium]